jgi:hypothetical protein
MVHVTRRNNLDVACGLLEADPFFISLFYGVSYTLLLRLILVLQNLISA